MTITYVSPEAETSTPAEPYALRLDLAKKPLRIALVSNTFPDVRNFVDCVEQALAPLLPGAKVKVWQKPSVEPVTPKMLEEIVAESDAVVAALGH
jgi:hypothetical protein